MADFSMADVPDNLKYFFIDFKANEVESKIKFFGTCSKCQKRITGDWKPVRVTSNFLTHAKKCSVIKYEQFLKEQDEGKKRQNVDEAAGDIKRFCRPVHVGVPSSVVDEAIVKFVVLDMLPISMVEHEGFRFLMNSIKPDYQLPTRKKFTEAVMTKCKQVMNSVEKLTREAKYCSAQADIWSSRRMHGYFGASLSFITKGVLETRLVSVKRFTGSHTADNVAVMYQATMQQFASPTTIVGIVTDNAANMIKAFLKPTIVPEEEGVPNEDGEGEEENEEIAREPINWNAVEDETGTLPIRYPCIAHTLQLVVHDGLSEASQKIKQVLAKSEALVSSIHKSCKATELLEEVASCKIPAPNSTRWNSKLSMISAIVKIEDEHEGALQRVCDALPSKPSLTANDFATLRELEKLLKPFAVATVRLQSETVVTSSQVLPTLIGLKKNIDKIVLRHCTSVKGGLLASLSNRCDVLFRQSHFLIAAVVDPRFKLR